MMQTRPSSHRAADLPTRGGRWVVGIVATLLLPAAIAACTDTPPPKPPGQPVVAGANPNPGQKQIGISDAPSSNRVGDPGTAAPRPMLASQASGAYQQALQAFGNGDLASAKRLFEQATQQDPRSHQAFYSLAVVQERLKDSGATSSYRQAFTLVPDYEPAIIAYAMLLAKKGQISEGDRFLTEKRGQMPKSAAVAATLAELKSLQKDTGSAQRIAQEALKLNPDYRPAMVIIARDHFRNRRLDLALYALQAILDGFEPVAENPPRDKDNGEALLLRGLIWKEQNNRFGAMDQFRKAVSKRPDLVEARIQLGAALLSAGGAEEALPILDGAVHYDPDSIAGHLNLGDAYRLLQRYGDAKREFDWVLAHDAGLPQVHYDLGLLYLYAPNIPGMTPKQQIGEAIRALTKFRELRARDEKDDSEELLNSAKIKEGELNAASAPVAPPPPPAAVAASDGGAGPPAPPADAGAPPPAAAPPPPPGGAAADAGASAAP
jgi:Tfp pilus assembly protein PilF